MRERKTALAKSVAGVLPCLCMFGLLGAAAICFAAGDVAGWSALGIGVGGASIPIDYQNNVTLKGEIRSLAVAPDGTLYAGGTFSKAGEASANSVAKWNGKTWSALGTGLDANVDALVIDRHGTLYAGGMYLMASGACLVKWNGTSWSDLASGNNGNIRALAVAPDGTLYASGVLPKPKGKSENVYKWNGSDWVALGPGIANANKGYVADVRALVVAQDGTLYAGGIFTEIGGVSANGIAKWNGTNWSALGSGMDGRSAVSALAIAPGGSLYAGGDFLTAGGKTANHLAKWDGSSWSPVGPGLAEIQVMALSIAPDGTLYAGGSGRKSNIAQWNGVKWSGLGTGVNGLVNALATGSDGILYAGGWFTKAGGKNVNYVAKWNVLSSASKP